MDHATLEHWVNINSGSHNRKGLDIMADALAEHLADLPGTLERIPLAPQKELDGSLIHAGDALRFKFRPEAPVQVLFSGHMDTVFDPAHPFQRWRLERDGRAVGPGVADMKGGLFILIEAVRAFLKADRGGALGGEILITADEEIGSPCSRALILETAARHHLGLVFESALPGGELVCRRKGTGVFRMVASGKSAHTGRDFDEGRNALVALCALMVDCHALNDRFPGAILNVGRLSGGGPVNVVPDRAEAWLNIRIAEARLVGEIRAALYALQAEAAHRWEGVHIRNEGGFTRQPKEESEADAALHGLWNTVERQLGMAVSGKRETGGSSDGNLLAEAGLPHLDGVGVRGGGIHSPEEFALLSSIQPQIDKTVAFLNLLAANPERVRAKPFVAKRS
jgi:glutamate carboxypeptidase